MQEKHLFEYAVIRVVPRVEREEFLNVGVILYCRKQHFLQAMFGVDKERLHNFSSNLNIPEVEECLGAFTKISEGNKQGGAIAKLPMAERFRWLTATRSTIVQTSPVHSGLCEDARETLVKLYEQLVK
ncbi:DUF3037 domain-containing protein [Segetibacter koreensis]|uniref:DUF3037 domain-containing protein n=1 Tax=Segetibacter koreensis TaxID=398037 RepID=UPI000371C4F9|nr:DUF3037 domain-containing protein [Segetibacter koreensis]